MLNFFKSKRSIIVLLMAVTILGAIFRFYDFFDLLLFETDQARDYKLINEIIQKGVGEFPLVGPKAGGTFFRLGPIYYIPAYLSALVFGVSPYALVFFEVLLSILTIPLFFLLLREFFGERISFYCTAIFAVTLFFVEYAHFSWNTNLIPFFFVLALFSMLKYLQDTNKMRWVLVLAFSCGIVMQLHTITLVGMPLIILGYFIFLKKRILLKHIIIFLGIIFFLFSPVIINDLLTRGENLKEFKKATISRTQRDDHPSLGKSIFMSGFNYIRYYSIILTSQNQIKELVRVESSKNLRELIGYNISKKDLGTNLFSGLLGTVFFVAGFGLLIFELWQIKKSDKKNQSSKRWNFLILMAIVQIIFGLILFPLALRVDSRYFFPVAIIPFIILGLVFNRMEKYFSWGRIGALIIFLVLFVFNIWGSAKWLMILENYNLKHETGKEFILDKYFIVTMQQWNGIVEKVASLSHDYEGNVYIQSGPFHINSFKNLLEIEKKKPVRVMDTKNLDLNGMYFFLRESSDIDAGDVLPESVGRRFDIIEKYDFGTVTLIQMKTRAGQKTEVKEKFALSQKGHPLLPRCYELRYDIEARENCTVGDVGYFFGR